MNSDREQLFRTLDERPTVAAYLQAARQVSAFAAELQPVRVALAASFTLDGAVPYLTVETARLGFAANVYVAPFNSMQQELLNPASGCVQHQPEFVFIANLLGDVCPALAQDALALDASQRERHLSEVVAQLTNALQQFRKVSPATVVVHNFARPQYPVLGIYEPMAPDAPTVIVNELNTRLVAALRGLPGVYVLDFDRVCAEVGFANAFDERMWHLGRAPLSATAWRCLAQTQAAFVRAVLGPQRKCLVLDLDNVLWGGVIGEAGLAGIQLGQTYPGNAYREFQQSVLELSRRGVLLALNSKNNLADVQEVFAAHPDMILKLEQFASVRINWQDKPQNMQEIANELGIGLESLVFFDDSPAEQERMRQTLPQVLTLPVPAEPVKFVKVLRQSRAFDRLSLTDEDRRRAAMYQDQTARRQLAAAATSVEDFLASLAMTVRIEAVDEFAFPRVVDLLQKTNQFNLTTRRHTASQLSALLAQPGWAAFAVRVCDRFGDNGIVGVAIVQRQGATAHLDSFLLSCRVIGRTIETAMLAFLADWARESALQAIEGEFIPTAKNAPAADFYERHGFTQLAHGANGSRWLLALADGPVRWPDYIQRQAAGREQPEKVGLAT